MTSIKNRYVFCLKKNDEKMLTKNKMALINILYNGNCSGNNKSTVQNKKICTGLCCDMSMALSRISFNKSFVENLSWNNDSSIQISHSAFLNENTISISDAADGINVYRAITVSDLILCGNVEGYSSNTMVSTIALLSLASAVGTLKKYSSESFLHNSISVSRFGVFMSDNMFRNKDKDIANIKTKITGKAK